MMMTTRSFATLLLLLFCASANATITIMETGQRFRSIQDNLGKQLWRGYEYMARLQYLSGNLSLCPPSSSGRSWNVTVPEDGLPVALLVRGGGCALSEKIKTAMEIQPLGVVKYLIIDNTEQYFPWPGEQPLESVWGDDANDNRLAIDDEIDTPDENDDDGHTAIPLYILHVSTRTEYDLLDYLLHQDESILQAGGPRLSIDSRTTTSFLDGEGAVWIALSALLSACACSFLLLAGGSQWLVEEELPPPPVRPQRRRLTTEQVRRLLPVYRYDGTALLPAEGPVSVDEENQGLVSAAAVVPPPEPVELSLCSICLDDYEAGDKLRCLPCNHAFHSRCVARWLAERSATCPLCKLDIEDEPEQEESSEEGEPQVAVPNVPDQEDAIRAWWNAFLSRNHAELEAEAPPTEPAAAAEAPASVDEPRPSRPPFWRRFFRLEPSASSSVETVSMLTEPLLAEPTASEPAQEPPLPASPARPPPEAFDSPERVSV